METLLPAITEAERQALLEAEEARRDAEVNAALTITPIPCPTCGGPGGAAWGCLRAVCDSCWAKQPKETPPDAPVASWKRHVPEEYQSAVASRVIIPGVLSWTPQQSLGLGVYGPAQLGKTSAIAVLVRSLNMRMMWTHGQKLRSTAVLAAAADEWSVKVDAQRTLARMACVPLLVLDDLDKGRFTEAFATALFGLMEERRNSRRPTIWTANRGGAQLREKIVDGCKDADLGDSLERRLMQQFTLCTATTH